MLITRLDLAKIRRALIKCSGDDTLAGYCGIASYIVVRTVLARRGAAEFYMNDFHCFSVVQKTFIDITAKQFNNMFPAIYMKRQPLLMDNGWEMPVHEIDKQVTFTRASLPQAESKLKRFFKDWPQEQNPYKNMDFVEEILTTV